MVSRGPNRTPTQADQRVYTYILDKLYWMKKRQAGDRTTARVWPFGAHRPGQTGVARESRLTHALRSSKEDNSKYRYRT